MEIKLFLTSKPFNPSVDGAPKQVYTGKDWVNNLVNKISVGSILSIVGPDLKGKLTHIFALKIKRNFEGATVGIAGNVRNVKGEFSLRYITLEDIGFFCTIDKKDSFEESNHGLDKIEEVLLKDTPWEGMSKHHFGYWPTITVLYHGQEVPYLNIISDEAKETLKELGTG